MELKICSKCKKEKTLDNFNKNKYREDGLQYHCKECKNKGNNKYIKKNYGKYLNYHQKRYIEKYEFLNNIKDEKSCLKCGENRNWILDFHHLDPSQKDKTIADLVGSSTQRLLKEIEKCITLCRNCHTDFHYHERSIGITIDDYLK